MCASSHPTSEIPFAGHPTLGTAYVIKHFLEGDNEDKVMLNLKVGQIPVSFKKDAEQETLWMKQVPPIFGRNISQPHGWLKFYSLRKRILTIGSQFRKYPQACPS